tara:strand:+ start:7793 stop:8398 length:606 start_codon:yes stop_codon:yes gene_type:complete
VQKENKPVYKDAHAAREAVPQKRSAKTKKITTVTVKSTKTAKPVVPTVRVALATSQQLAAAPKVLLLSARASVAQEHSNARTAYGRHARARSHRKQKFVRMEKTMTVMAKSMRVPPAQRAALQAKPKPATQALPAHLAWAYAKEVYKPARATDNGAPALGMSPLRKRSVTNKTTTVTAKSTKVMSALSVPPKRSEIATMAL